MYKYTSFKKWQLSFSLILFALIGNAQETLPFRYAKCNTRVADTGYYMKNASQFLAERLSFLRSENPQEEFTSPYNIPVFIRIVRNDNGTSPGTTIETALQNFNEMNGQYNGHNICFQLAGIDFVNDTYLNNFNNSNLLDTDYPAYIRDNNLDIDGAMTIFIHFNFMNNTGSSGNAYGIPNNFMSIARWAVQSDDVRSIFGHEMGHCLGLYHTFESSKGNENVTRNSANSCYDCEVDGDLCCDTPADYEDSQDNTSSSTCTYSGSRRDACDALFQPSTRNIMSYQPWTCISTTSTAITTDQRTRMHATILNPSSPIYNRVSETNVTQTALTNSSATIRIYPAKNNFSTNNGSAITHSGNARAYYVAGNSITFNPGTTLSPNANGIIQGAISGCN